jgi:hypothetical protein
MSIQSIWRKLPPVNENDDRHNGLRVRRGVAIQFLKTHLSLP